MSVGLYGTLVDYLKFVRIMPNLGVASKEQVFKPVIVDLKSRNAIGDSNVAMLRTVALAMSHDADFFPGMPNGWI
jgi:methyl acetate hydrolase